MGPEFREDPQAFADPVVVEDPERFRQQVQVHVQSGVWSRVKVGLRRAIPSGARRS